MTNLNKDYWAVKVPKEMTIYDFALIGIEHQILGHITKYDCTVDAEKIVEEMDSNGYFDYRNKGCCDTAQESLYSLLESKGIYFVNPMGKNPPETNVECCGFWQDDGFGNPQCCHQPVPDRNSQEAEYLWREFESHLAEKVILIRKL